jgi:hypothetical protein
MNTIKKLRGAQAPENKNWHCKVDHQVEGAGSRDDYRFWLPSEIAPIKHTHEDDLDVFVFQSPVKATAVMKDGREGEIRETYTFEIHMPTTLPEGTYTFEPRIEIVVAPMPDMPKC